MNECTGSGPDKGAGSISDGRAEVPQCAARLPEEGAGWAAQGHPPHDPALHCHPGSSSMPPPSGLDFFERAQSKELAIWEQNRHLYCGQHAQPIQRQ